MRLSSERNCSGFSVKASTWVPFQSAQQLVIKSPSPGWCAKSVCAWSGASRPLPCCLVLLSALSLLRKDGEKSKWAQGAPCGAVTIHWGNACHWWIVSIPLEKYRSGPILHTVPWQRVNREDFWVSHQNCCVPQSFQLWNEVRNLHEG